jgi:uncharacterized protein (DUF427 family)
MTDRLVLEPTADHPITITPTGTPVTVRVNGEVVAQTGDALTLQEAAYAPVQYIPYPDVAVAKLVPSDKVTYCPFKGEARHYSVRTDSGDVVADSVWRYEQAYPWVGEIAGRVAFYPDKADIIIG